MLYPSNQLKLFLGVPILLIHFSTNLDSLENGIREGNFWCKQQKKFNLNELNKKTKWRREVNYMLL